MTTQGQMVFQAIGMLVNGIDRLEEFYTDYP